MRSRTQNEILVDIMEKFSLESGKRAEIRTLNFFFLHFNSEVDKLTKKQRLLLIQTSHG
jgi:hypothetical protein